MVANHERYLYEMRELGYTHSYAVLDAREFGLQQARRRVITISSLADEGFDFSSLIRTPMKPLNEFLETDVPEHYTVTQSSVLNCIGNKGIKRTTVIEEYAMTITCRQDRTPAQVIDLGKDKYRYLTERECWRLQGFTDSDFDAACIANPCAEGKMNRTLYKQAGNSMPVPMLESIFRKIFLNKVGK